jgi:hypothetical protein
MDRQLGLELSDTLFRCREFGLLGRRDAGLEASVNSSLAAPGVDLGGRRIIKKSDLGDLPTTLNQTHYASPKFLRVASPRHIALLSR